MNPSSETGGPSSLGTSRMAIVLGLALVVNFGLLLVPMFFGSSGDSAVAANLNANSPSAPRSVAPSVVTPAANASPTESIPTESPQQDTTQEPPVESPDVVTIVGDEPPTPAVTVLPAPGDDVARVESPAPAEITDNADPVTPASNSPSDSGSDDPPTEVVIDLPADLGSVPPPAPMPDFDPCILEIVNPAETNGPVHFVIEGAVHTLLPGESRQWLALSERLVEFHRGDDFGDISYRVERGTWRFQVTDVGWELVADEHVSMFVR